MFGRYCLATAVCLSMLLTSCWREEFDGDIVDPRLPEYSETGANHGGAYFNGQPLRFFPRPHYMGWYDLATIHFNDSLDLITLRFPSSNLIRYDGSRSSSISLRFVIQQEDLQTRLQGSHLFPLVFDLSGALHRAELAVGEIHGDFCPSISGTLFLRHANELEGALQLSGTFGFDVSHSCGGYEIRSGRFDFIFENRF